MATNKSTNPALELEQMREKLEIAVAHLKYAEQWSRVHDYAFRLKTIGVLKELGEWPSQ